MWRPHLPVAYYDIEHEAKSISPREMDVYWGSNHGIGREKLLNQVVHDAKRLGWLGVFNNAWATWDVKFVGDLWHTLHLYTVTEELGENKRFTRARITAKPTLLNRAISVSALIWSAAALASLQPLALVLAMLGSAVALMQNISSRRACLRAAVSLVARAGQEAELDRVDTSGHTLGQHAFRAMASAGSELAPGLPETIPS
jgi:hypothetical protein